MYFIEKLHKHLILIDVPYIYAPIFRALTYDEIEENHVYLVFFFQICECASLDCNIDHLSVVKTYPSSFHNHSLIMNLKL